MTHDSGEIDQKARVEQHVQEVIENFMSQQNFPLAIIAGIVASIIAAGIWAAITVASQYQIGWLAVGVGFLVGFAVRVAGRGLTTKFGIAGAGLALFGCVLGNFLSIIGFISTQQEIGYFDLLARIDYSLVPDIMVATFQPMDLLFYGIAVYEGYKFSFRRLSAEDFNLQIA